LIALAAGCLVLSASPAARLEAFGPWSVDSRHPVMQEPASAAQPVPARLSSNPFSLAFEVWRDLITRIDGTRCAHRPSCSAFAHQAISRHRLIPGMWMAINRLIRGARSSALRILPRSGNRFLDRLEDNTFWKSGYLPMSGR
jgi:putative component of membrane protein insertase Oxa1/YidC/SpoIIIJ protein YidD